MGVLQPIVLPEPTDAGRFSAVDPLDGRYYDAEIARYLSEQTRIAFQAHIEAALGHALAAAGVCSQEVADEIDAARFKLRADLIAEEEKKLRQNPAAAGSALLSKVFGAAR